MGPAHQSGRLHLSRAVPLLLVPLVLAMSLLAAAHTEGLTRFLVLVLGLATLALSVLNLLSVRGKSTPVATALEEAKRIAAGDLTTSNNALPEQESGTLMHALHSVSEGMFKVVSEVRRGTTMMATTTSQINRDNEALSKRTENQAASLEETASTIEQLTATVKQNANNAQQANQMVMAASNQAAKGGEAMGQVIQTMESIEASSRRIVDIIGVIDSIAFQTNILALNAAVEAARAGEQGRGFAVVASEVRNLAQRAAAAAKDIKSLIENAVDKINTGTTQVGDAGKTIDDIVTSVKVVADIMKEISSASLEQSTGIETVSKAVIEIEQMTQQNAQLVDGVNATSKNLRDLAVTLMNTVSGFELGSREYANAEEAEAMVNCGAEFMQQHGKQAFLDEVNKTIRGQFIDRDMYLWVVRLTDGICVAHGSDLRLLNIDGYKLKDAGGKSFVAELMALAKSKGSGWVDYKWVHPITNETIAKSSYAKRMEDIMIVCGYYKK